MKNSQVSIEFLFAIGIVFFIFLMLFGFMFNRNIELRESERKINERNTCLLVSTLMTSAFISGDGVFINETIDYVMNISEEGNYKHVDIVNGSYCLSAIRYASNGKLQKGVIEIKNQNNYIDIDNV